MHYYNKAIGKAISGRKIFTLIVAGLVSPVAATEQTEFFRALRERFATGGDAYICIILGLTATLILFAAIAIRASKERARTQDTAVMSGRETQRRIPKRKEQYRFTESKTGMAARNEKPCP